PPSSCSAGPIGDDLFYWQAIITDPTFYTRRCVFLCYLFPKDYPFKQPRINDYQCLLFQKINLLHDCCNSFYVKEFNQSFTIQVLLLLCSMMTDPNPGMLLHYYHIRHFS
ncbi:hypothetical protein RhiirA5_476155, partial [Rhizophagus irregularis]